MSTADTRTLITEAVRRFEDEVPSLKQLKLVLRLELRARGDAPVWRVEVPGPAVSKEAPVDARLDLSIGRPEFNRLATEGTLRDWVRAFQQGHVRVSGDAAVMKLLGNVIERRLARVN